MPVAEVVKKFREQEKGTDVLKQLWYIAAVRAN